MDVHVLKEMYVLKERYASSNVAETKLTAYKNRFILITVIASSTGQALYKSTSILEKDSNLPIVGKRPPQKLPTLELVLLFPMHPFSTP